ncbi:MAG: hypothetical protein RIQ52_580 [Pseudomonadota bacterium]
MCGIAGIMMRHGPVEQAWLERMAGQLGHRGPDGTGYYRAGAVGLVHTRLSIIDLAGGQQPLLAREGSVATVANGEIYNFPELRVAQGERGAQFTSHSDCEHILHGYLQDPEHFVETLHGMFAFALYDSESGDLYLARDRLGIKPLFYVELPDRLLFASEVKALLPLLPHTPEIDGVALSQFLHNRSSTGNAMLFRGIRRVAPGEIIRFDRDLRPVARTYWTPRSIEPQPMSLEEGLEAFDALFDTVMREHMRSDVPYGLFLSGGNDSAILLAMLSRLQDQPVRTFSVGYADASMKDELEGAGRMAKLFGSQHTELRLGRDELFRRIAHSVWCADELMRDPASLPTSALSQMAAKDLKVVFVGEGGDEVFAGYRRYRQPPLFWWLMDRFFPGSGGFRVRSEWWRPASIRLLGAELQRLRQAAREPYMRAWQEAPASWSHLQHCQYTDMVTTLPDNLLVKVDRMMMGFGLEGRVPFLDHRIVEFGFSLPDHLKIQGSTPKAFLRHWAGRHIPHDHLHQKKKGFVVPVREWLRGDFLRYLEQKLSANPAVQAWFDVRHLPALFRAQEARGIASREIFCLMQFAIWHHLFIENHGNLCPGTDENPLDWMR